MCHHTDILNPSTFSFQTHQGKEVARSPGWLVRILRLWNGPPILLPGVCREELSVHPVSQELQHQPPPDKQLNMKNSTTVSTSSGKKTTYFVYGHELNTHLLPSGIGSMSHGLILSLSLLSQLLKKYIQMHKLELIVRIHLFSTRLKRSCLLETTHVTSSIPTRYSSLVSPIYSPRRFLHQKHCFMNKLIIK